MKVINFNSFRKTILFHYLKKYFRLILTLLDVTISAFLFVLSFFIIKHTIHPNLYFGERHYIFIILLFPTLLILLQTTNVSKIPRTSRYLELFFDFTRFSIILSILCFLFIFLFKLKPVSIYLVSLFLVINHFGLFYFRVITYRLFKNYRISGNNYKNIIIIADENSLPVIEKIRYNREWGFKILFIITNSKKIKHIALGANIKTYPESVNIKSLLEVDIIDEVIHCKSQIDKDEIKGFIKICSEIGVTFRLQSVFVPTTFENGFLTQLEDLPALTVMKTPKNYAALTYKTITESAFAFIALLLLSPFLFLTAILVKIDSKGPVFFKQKRVGLRGRQFYIYKFRTMVMNAEEKKKGLQSMNESDGPTFKIKHDPRITKIGHLLRRTSIDELPQLINVLKGEMALIGPRPPIPQEVKEYERWQLRRLSVKPGLTCTWQISPNRNDMKFDKWVKLDLQYIDSWSLKKDIEIFLRTLKAVIINKGY